MLELLYVFSPISIERTLVGLFPLASKTQLLSGIIAQSLLRAQREALLRASHIVMEKKFDMREKSSTMAPHSISQSHNNLCPFWVIYRCTMATPVFSMDKKRQYLWSPYGLPLFSSTLCITTAQGIAMHSHSAFGSALTAAILLLGLLALAVADTLTVVLPRAAVRLGPSTSHDVLVTVSKDMAFPILATDKGWHKIPLEDGQVTRGARILRKSRSFDWEANEGN